MTGTCGNFPTTFNQDPANLGEPIITAELLESYIRQADTAEQFSELVKSKRPAPDASEMSNQKFSVIRNSVLAGCGVGKDLVQTYVPDAVVSRKACASP